jgi:hypothetical protein
MIRLREPKLLVLHLIDKNITRNEQIFYFFSFLLLPVFSDAQPHPFILKVHFDDSAVHVLSTGEAY